MDSNDLAPKGAHRRAAVEAMRAMLTSSEPFSKAMEF
jgi:hypothetical protein